MDVSLQADVRGYLLKDSPSEELARSIRSIIEGQRIYCPELIDEDSNQNEQAIEVLQPLIERPTKINTVRNYLTTILDKIKLPTG